MNPCNYEHPAWPSEPHLLLWYKQNLIKHLRAYLYWHRLSTAKGWRHNYADQQRKWTHAPGRRTTWRERSGEQIIWRQRNRLLLEQDSATQTSFCLAIRVLSCGIYNSRILSMIRLDSKPTLTTVSNTRLKWESCQSADYSFMTAAVMREPDSNGYQYKYW